jgi:hypothetical protein
VEAFRQGKALAPPSSQEAENFRASHSPKTAQVEVKTLLGFTGLVFLRVLGCQVWKQSYISSSPLLMPKLALQYSFQVAWPPVTHDLDQGTHYFSEQRHLDKNTLSVNQFHLSSASGSNHHLFIHPLIYSFFKHLPKCLASSLTGKYKHLRVKIPASPSLYYT